MLSQQISRCRDRLDEASKGPFWVLLVHFPSSKPFLRHRPALRTRAADRRVYFYVSQLPHKPSYSANRLAVVEICPDKGAPQD